MADDSQGAAAGDAAAGGGVRRIVLFGVLALMIVALGYDYLVARPAVGDAYEQIAEASIKANAKGNDILTNVEVQQLLGREPAETRMDGPQRVEVFHYMGGLIVKPHKLFTVYRKTGDEWMFSRHSKFAYDESQDVGASEIRIVAGEPEANTEQQYPEEGAGDGEPGGAEPNGAEPNGAEPNGDNPEPPQRPAAEEGGEAAAGGGTDSEEMQRRAREQAEQESAEPEPAPESSVGEPEENA